MKKFALFGASFALLAVALGAFGAHALKTQLGDSATTWETAVHYQMFHAVALIVIALLIQLFRDAFFTIAGWLMIGGVVLFSGSLYTLSLVKITAIGIITPIGGVLFITAWIFIILGLARINTSRSIY
ncbi:DUF423 domain-containing protein [Brochothrix campestris]|uniref:DUF423 domain-containing protein n=1 Tax=Brochothrix campestris FSL F6-1037 TaxID=1265861 RepID=W7CHQ5_9LIST|nr:DUF423 domain-containing protein [Brochothrix campestris]EUJ38909.1 hypothetical protein BCAMP_08355 [Brochothrix campestris FSL F6-1037]